MSGSDLSSLWEEAIASLDLPEALSTEAVLTYQDVASWLGEQDSPLQPHRPELYPQGSFRLGTPVRPHKAKDEFDIDLVCKLEIKKERISQADLKQMVGRRLRAHPEHGTSVDERRRCWTISFETRFHLDVLPAIPDEEQAGSSLLITDMELTRWQPSNPIGFADWFYSRMVVPLNESREALAKSLRASIEDVPVWAVRTPLQRTVQLLKRHRDVRFRGSPQTCPVSVILTTLAAKAYQQERRLEDAIVSIVSRMPEGIEKRNGKWWVENPAHPDENFADKWNEEPERRVAFLKWLEALSADVSSIAHSASSQDARRLTEGLLDVQGAKERLLLESTVPDVDSTSHIKSPLWPVSLRYHCGVTVGVHRRKRHGPRLWYMGARLVPKSAGLRFEATTDTPQPFEIKWQVSNSGAEARKAGALRGGFEDGEGRMGNVRWEETRYRGTHLVEAFVIKDGVAVARSGPVPVRVAR